tara:strand:+ start:2202 stop:2576 length:375 start_codon:yes stop_codon:yes gene_type:complete
MSRFLRTCGDCSECCRAFPLDQTDTGISPSGVFCKWCTQPGCSLYTTEQFPTGCRDFFCGWIQNENIPENLKPNLTGVILQVLDNNLNTSKFWIDEKNFESTDIAVKKLEEYSQRKYTTIYNGE